MGLLFIGLVWLSTITATSLCTFMCLHSKQACNLICGDVISEVSLTKNSLEYYKTIYHDLLNDLLRPVPLAISGILEPSRNICNQTVDLLYSTCQSKLKLCESQFDTLPCTSIIPLLEEDMAIEPECLLIFIWSVYLTRCYILYGNLEWVSPRDRMAPCA